MNASACRMSAAAAGSTRGGRHGANVRPGAQPLGQQLAAQQVALQQLTQEQPLPQRPAQLVQAPNSQPAQVPNGRPAQVSQAMAPVAHLQQAVSLDALLGAQQPAQQAAPSSAHDLLSMAGLPASAINAFAPPPAASPPGPACSAGPAINAPQKPVSTPAAAAPYGPDPQQPYRAPARPIQPPLSAKILPEHMPDDLGGDSIPVSRFRGVLWCSERNMWRAVIWDAGQVCCV